MLIKVYVAKHGADKYTVRMGCPKVGRNGQRAYYCLAMFEEGGGFYHDEVSTAYFAHKKGQELAAMPEAIQATVNRYVASLSPEEAAFIDTGKAWH